MRRIASAFFSLTSIALVLATYAACCAGVFFMDGALFAVGLFCAAVALVCMRMVERIADAALQELIYGPMDDAMRIRINAAINS